MRLPVAAGLAASLLLVSTLPLRAQHCWPSAVVLVLRDARGRVVDPGRGYQISVAPQPSPKVDFRYAIRTLGSGWGERPPLAGDTVPAMTWAGAGACAIDITEVTIRRSDGRTMRLLPNVHVNTQRHPGQSTWVIDTPPFRAGTFRLALCTLPAANPSHRWAVVPATSWVRDSGLPPGPCADPG
ncbi:MAG TPA: hypothetical protein VFH27_00405 [Longimicrobiaceae bacterium]|nr:hypothetical protein [Longimicrobiaceae bacterium]